VTPLKPLQAVRNCLKTMNGRSVWGEGTREARAAGVPAPHCAKLHDRLVNVVGTRDLFASRQARQLVSEIKGSYWQWMRPDAALRHSLSATQGT